jgi:hypothetical protein
VWNAHAPELWRRTTIAIRRLDKLAMAHGTRVKLSYAKVARPCAAGGPPGPSKGHRSSACPRE